MAISKFNLAMHGVRGSIGKQVVFRQYQDKTVVSAHPQFKENRVFSEKQLRRQQLMKEANAWARDISQDPAQHDAALLRLNVTTNRLYTSLIKEFFRIVKESEAK